MKAEVYSWRVSAKVKADLEREARARKAPVSAILDLAVRDWLKKSGLNFIRDAAQRRLRAARQAASASWLAATLAARSGRVKHPAAAKAATSPLTPSARRGRLPKLQPCAMRP